MKILHVKLLEIIKLFTNKKSFLLIALKFLYTYTQWTWYHAKLGRLSKIYIKRSSLWAEKCDRGNCASGSFKEIFAIVSWKGYARTLIRVFNWLKTAFLLLPRCCLLLLLLLMFLVCYCSIEFRGNQKIWVWYKQFCLSLSSLYSLQTFLWT